ncbi:hypothetical protein BT96DRAFT_949514 [Gymnopus androsaceus JB14]|uniref:Uncharacterized protein n=1 Tax=Gymnopus androsaceus JB14 TaxID=1447944 RepID=A0A6A4GKL0_9AGAR|nr:hypothetical protein BT96DRAFT_949514 [Gymnopus androsaceus JB14]
MTCGHPLSDDLCSALICMGEQLPLNSVAKFSGVPTRTLQRLYKEYQKQGHGLRVKAGLETRGAKHMLSIDDTGFVVGQVEHKKDIYLDELWVLVQERLKVDVDETTIWHYL